LQAWQLYNANIKAFYDEHPNQCLLVHIDGLVGQFQQFAHLLQDKLQLDIRFDANTFDQIFHAAELQKTPLLPEVTDILSKLFPELIELYNQFNAQADLPPDTSRPDSAAAQPLSALAGFTATLTAPISLSARHSHLQLLVSLLAPEPTETMLCRFYHSAQGTQQKIDQLWLHAQRLERLNIEQSGILQEEQTHSRAQHAKLQEQDQQIQHQALQTQKQHHELGKQAAQIQSLLAELGHVYETRAWKLIETYSSFKERWQRKDP